MVIVMIFGTVTVHGATSSPLKNTNTLKKLETQLSRLDQNLLTLQNSLEAIKKEKANISIPIEEKRVQLRVYFEDFMHFIHEKTEDLSKGIVALWQGTKNIAHWRPSFEGEELPTLKVVFKFLVSLAAGILFSLLSHRWLKKFSKFFLKWGRHFKKTQTSLENSAEFLIGLFIALCPPIISCILQVGIFFLIEENTLLQKTMLSLATGLLIWTGILQIQLFLLRHKKIFLLRYVSLEAQKSLGSRIQTFLFCLIVGGWTDEITAFYGLPESGRKILMIGFGMGMVISFFGLTQILKRPILRTLQAHNFESFTFLTFLWTGIWNSFALIFYVLFILDETLLNVVFWPMMATLFLIPLVPFLHRGLRRIHLTYLWRKRHVRPQTPFYRFLRPHVRVKKAIKISVYGITIFALIKIWDIHLLFWFKNLLGPQIYGQFIDAFILLITALMIVSVGDRLLRHYLEKNSGTDGTIEALYLQGRVRTLLTLARTFLRVGVWVPFVLLFLSILGYNITLILTSLGIFSVTLTFGVQSLVKDFFTGFFILLDNSLIVGDQVEIDGRTGIVEDLSLRTLKIRADNGMLQTIPFGSITVIGNKSRYFSYIIINFSAQYDTDPEKIQQLLEKAYQTLRRTSGMNKKILAPIEIRGITDISDYAIVFQARLKTAPGQQDIVRRAYNKILKQLCDEAGIRVPSPSYPGFQQKQPSLTSTVLP